MKIENNQYPKYVSQINMDLANHNVAKREEKTESKRDTVEISKEAQALKKHRSKGTKIIIQRNNNYDGWKYDKCIF